MNSRKFSEIEQNISDGVSLGLMQVVIDDAPAEGRFIQIDNRRCFNFASCSYLGFELDRRIIESICASAKRYGSQFATSRAYLSVHLCEQIEERFQEICQRPAILTTTTTLGHLSAIPVLIGDEDAVILDHQVHNSVSAACRALKVRGIHIELLSHNNMRQLERKIQHLKSKYKKIWYLIDGLYSMDGDFAPLEDLELLLNQYEQLHIYADDAHGASWQGKYGQGAVLAKFAHHPNVTVALSLCKSFACGGGILALADTKAKKKVRDLGETLTFSSPIQPPMLGGIRASADIHLSEELAYHQIRLNQKIQLFNSISAQMGVRLKNNTISPIRFIEIGSRENTAWLACRLLEKGFYASVAGFPSVGKNRNGIRVSITNHLKDEDIESFLDAIYNSLCSKRNEDLRCLLTEDALVTG